MYTKLIMIFSAAALGLYGIVLIFLPQETASYMGFADESIIVLQILGALYFGFAIVNWTSKQNIIGGIYGRPIAIGNFAHFIVGAFALIKFGLKNPSGTMFIITAVLYSILAAAFGYILFLHPGIDKTKTR